jgi:hypothetical protein
MTRRALVAASVAIAALALPTAASAADGDHDGMPDRWEKQNGLQVKHKDGAKDRDHDGLKNLSEFKAGTDPRDADSDNDGVEDGDEGAGRIRSFDKATGVLTIDLFAGGTLTGKVDGTTEIDCEHGDDDDPPATGPAPTRASKGGGDRSPSSSAPGRGDDGDDDRPAAGSTPPSDQHGNNEQDDDNDPQNCSTADLTPGRAVKEAKLNAAGNGDPGVFDEIELAV